MLNSGWMTGNRPILWLRTETTVLKVETNLWKHFHFPLSWPFFKRPASPPHPHHPLPSPLPSLLPAAAFWLVPAVCCLLLLAQNFIEGSLSISVRVLRVLGKIQKSWKLLRVCVCGVRTVCSFEISNKIIIFNYLTANFQWIPPNIWQILPPKKTESCSATTESMHVIS